MIEAAVDGVRLYFTSLPFLALNTMVMYYFQAIEKGNLSTILALCKGVLFVFAGIVILVPLWQIYGVWMTVTFAEGLCLLVGVGIDRKIRCK